jgi:hypothetical protein
MRARQRSRLTKIKHGDARTKYFFLRANVRRRKKHIQILQTPNGIAIKHKDKEKELFHHFEELLGTKQARMLSLNWEELNYPHFTWRTLMRTSILRLQSFLLLIYLALSHDHEHNN